MREKLTKRTVDAMAPRAERYAVFDTEVKGFHVRVLPSGRKVYWLKYIADGDQQVEKIGEHGAPWTAEQARKEAERLRGQITGGLNPKASRRAAKQAAEEARRRALTVAELIARYLQEGPKANPSKRAISWQSDETRLNRHIVPLLGHLSAHELRRHHIEDAQCQIAAGATSADNKTGHKGRSIVRGGPSAARAAIVALGTCLAWAVERELVDDNPAARVKKGKPGRRERFLSEDELSRLFDAIADMQQSRALHAFFADAIRLLALTGARKAEIMNLSWQEVHLDRGLILLPRHRSKTGEKAIVLSAPAAAILAGRNPQGQTQGYVFPSPSDPQKPMIGVQKAWERVRKRANLEDVRLHDLRHTFASLAAARGASLPLIGKALGHSQSSTTERYTHFTNDPVRAVVDRIGETIIGKPETAPAVIQPFPKARKEKP